MSAPVFPERLSPGLERPHLGGSTRNSKGTTSGNTMVTMVTAPEDSYATVFLVTVHNADSAAIDLNLYITNTAGANWRIDRSAALAAGGHYISQAKFDHVALNPGESLRVNLDGAVSATEPRWTVQWAAPV